ncbi:DUF3336 domain-containing protein [Alteromonas sp. M12]|uniref:DUF3336 domain-containing protein n=1 Tax=Alteromonas sp. M12 TaxID=3135644 RepID=UPI00319DC211
MLLDTKNSVNEKMKQAKNYNDWKKAALKKDETSRLNLWRSKDQTSLYDYKAIRVRLERLRIFRRIGDNHGLLFTLNEGIHGNMAGIGNEALYKVANVGTKTLIEDYINEIASSLIYLASSEVKDISYREKSEFFERASQCFGKTALMLSGAGTLLYFHLGVVKSLWEQNLLPNIISGSSGGALVASLVATHSHNALERIFDTEYLKLEAEREESLFQKLSFFSSDNMASEEIVKHLKRLIPDITFHEAYELTGIHLNISIAPAEQHQNSRLLNAIASPNVLIREAILASCAAPGFFPSVTLAAKNEKGEKQAYLPTRKWVDGSLSEDLPIKKVARLYGVNHYIVSQTNPLALPFISETGKRNSLTNIFKDTFKKTAKDWSLAGEKVLQKPLRSNDFLSKALRTYSSLASQIYLGNINILPHKKLYNPFRFLSHRSKDEILELINNGEKSSWPKIEAIKLQTMISRTLEMINRDYNK